MALTPLPIPSLPIPMLRHQLLVFSAATALLVLSGCAAIFDPILRPPLRPVAYDTAADLTSAPATASAARRSTPEDPYLVRLRETYDLDAVVAGAETDTDRMMQVASWARSRWEHNGSNRPSKSDPITILEEAEGGERFRCVEYAVVVAGALNAVGIPARVVGLKSADVETRWLGAGHVVAEAWLADLQKWALVDGQFDAVVMLDGVPQSAAEIRLELDARPSDLRVVGVGLGDSDGREGYLRWLAPYLYYLDVGLDERYGTDRQRGRLMLVPEGAPEPHVFQRKSPIRHTIYTRSLAAFYAPPSAGPLGLGVMSVEGGR